jgi:NAD+ synthase
MDAPMTNALTIALAQINPTVGDVDGNAELVRAARAATRHADLIVFGELVLCGYPPEDLVLKHAFQNHVAAAVERLALETADDGPAMLIGAPWRIDGHLRNAALLLDRGRVVAEVAKVKLPNYGVFDEMRLFTPGPLSTPVPFHGLDLGIMICEDMWTPDVARHLRHADADALIVLNGSPFEIDKWGFRRTHAADRVAETGLPLVYVNLIGGQDELVFDGASFVLDDRSQLIVQAPSWRTSIVGTTWRCAGDGTWHCMPGEVTPRSGGAEAVWQAMVTGLRDYVDKNGFPGVVLGLSGGIDSALTAAVAVDALGAARVRGVMMASPFTSAESLEDAAETARLLGVRLDSIGIEPAMEAFARMLAPTFGTLAPDATEENIQARTRGLVLMALSNKFGDMLLTTGNKSEMSVGYATLYGDMCGGFSVLKDVYKTTVYQLAGWRNRERPDGALGPDGRVVPERVITKAPTAELKANQTDQDTLPPYDELDAILEGLIEDEASIADIAERGHDEATVRRIWRMVDRAEYKRRQAPPGVKITERAFGRDRRYPITNGFTRSV